MAVRVGTPLVVKLQRRTTAFHQQHVSTLKSVSILCTDNLGQKFLENNPPPKKLWVAFPCPNGTFWVPSRLGDAQIPIAQARIARTVAACTRPMPAFVWRVCSPRVGRSGTRCRRGILPGLLLQVNTHEKLSKALAPGLQGPSHWGTAMETLQSPPSLPAPRPHFGIPLRAVLLRGTRHGQRLQSAPQRSLLGPGAAVLLPPRRFRPLWPAPCVSMVRRDRGPRAARSPGGALAGAADSECAARPRPPYWMPQPPRSALPPVSSLRAAGLRGLGGSAATREPAGGRGRRRKGWRVQATGA